MDIVTALREQSHGSKTSDRILMARAAAEIEELRNASYEADQALVDKYREPKTGTFNFPGDVAKIIRRFEAEAAKRQDPCYGPDFSGDPIDAIKTAMAARGLTNVDLYEIFGAKSRVSEVLRRKRPLQVSHIRQLHNLLDIPYVKLVEAYKLDRTLSGEGHVDD